MAECQGYLLETSRGAQRYGLGFPWGCSGDWYLLVGPPLGSAEWEQD